MVRGVRPLTDIAAEFTMMMANRQLDPDIETVFLMADEEFSHVSSSLIKEITPLANDDMLVRFLPREIIPDLRRRYLAHYSTRTPIAYPVYARATETARLAVHTHGITGLASAGGTLAVLALLRRRRGQVTRGKPSNR